MRPPKKRPYALSMNGEISRTEQAHLGDVNINQIMRKAQQGIPSDYINNHAGNYGDATSLEFYEAQVIVANAKSLFEDLPSQLRNRFDNEPGKFLDFVQDPKNKDELVELKLANKPANIPDPPVVQPTEPDQPPEAPAPAAS